MASTINGNVGGAAAVGAQVQCVNNRTQQVRFAVGDSSGNYTIPNLSAAKYIVTATLSGDVYYHPIHVDVDGVTTYSSVNLNPVLLNASNVPAWTGNF